MENVLLVSVDSLRADHLGCYGYERETSPTIDSLAASGHLFENAFAHGGTTRKSFPSIMTSTYPLMYGGFERISEERTLISEVLSAQGYRTAGFHSNPYLSSEFGYARGFDTFYDSQSDPSVTARLREGVKRHLDQDGVVYTVLENVFERTEKHAGVEIGSAYADAETITDLAVESLDAPEEDSPAYLWVHYMDVHHPYLPGEEYQEYFREDPISERRAIQLRRKMLESPGKVTPSERQALIDLYDAEIRYTDEHVQRLLQAVREAWGEVVVVLVSDHGEEFGEHGQYSHNTHHDEGIHVPLIIDDDSDGGRYEEMVGLVDVAPTIADYTDAEVPESFQGDSLKTLVETGTWGREAVFGQWGDPAPGERNFYYRDREWKYMRFADGAEALYDLTTDPGEHENLIGDEPSVLGEIRAAVDDHERLVDSTYKDLGQVEMDESVRERLKLLGYKE